MQLDGLSNFHTQLDTIIDHFVDSLLHRSEPVFPFQFISLQVLQVASCLGMLNLFFSSATARLLECMF